jgi:hypothetical protein
MSAPRGHITAGYLQHLKLLFLELLQALESFRTRCIQIRVFLQGLKKARAESTG